VLAVQHAGAAKRGRGRARHPVRLLEQHAAGQQRGVVVPGCAGRPAPALAGLRSPRACWRSAPARGRCRRPRTRQAAAAGRPPGSGQSGGGPRSRCPRCCAWWPAAGPLRPPADGWCPCSGGLQRGRRRCGVLAAGARHAAATRTHQHASTPARPRTRLTNREQHVAELRVVQPSQKVGLVLGGVSASQQHCAPGR
jgi:hypothetical protein